MTESHEASTDITLIRRDLARLRDDVKQVGDQVKEVEAKVERSNATQLGAMAAALSGDGVVSREVLLKSTGMSTADIAAVLGKSENAVRVALRRARKRARIEPNQDAG
jgi:DNA-directed RNA polymerase specialized sigma24 family protein